MALPIIVQSIGANLSGLAGDVATLSFANPPKAGNTVVCVYSNPEPEGHVLTSVVDNYGPNNLAYVINEKPAAQSDVECWALQSLPVGGSGTYTVSATLGGTPGNATASMFLMELSGCTGIDQIGVGSTGASPIAVTANGVNVYATDLVLMAVSGVGNLNSLTATGAYTTQLFYGQPPALGVWVGSTNVPVTATGGATWTNASPASGIIVTFSGTLDAGRLPQPGPGISPAKNLMFRTMQRDTSGQTSVMSGISYGTSLDYGQLGSIGGPGAYCASTSFALGQLSAAIAISGLSYGASMLTGAAGQAVLVARFTGPGPGISPESLFQFSSMALDESLIQQAGRGFSASVSSAYGSLMGIGSGLAGVLYASSMLTGLMIPINANPLTLLSFATSFALGAPQQFAPEFPWGLDIYDNLNGSVLVAWGAFFPLPDSYNVYLAVVPTAPGPPTSGLLESAAATVASMAVPATPLSWELVTNVTPTQGGFVFGGSGFGLAGFGSTLASGVLCTITGLQIASYNASTQVVTPSLKYAVKIVAVKGGQEVGNVRRDVTPGPTSVMLETSMKRLWPFPNTGLD
jgi:hypothetical protein